MRRRYTETDLRGSLDKASHFLCDSAGWGRRPIKPGVAGGERIRYRLVAFILNVAVGRMTAELMTGSDH